jgi:hypothetical protein
MMLERYWPEADAVNACIKNEAETADVSVLLAVHQPSQLAQRNGATGDLSPASEKDLLDAFLTDHVPTGALLVPITGPSGIGKSHIVRWLDAQLQRSTKRDSLHIIRIPKSASLRTVVELILEPLKDDPRYAKARDDVTQAVGEVNLQEAVITFRAHLQNALTALSARIVDEIRENPDGNRDKKALIGHAKMLPQLFADAALEQHFVDNVLSRVVSRALRGREEGKDDDALPQFVATDLVLPESAELNKASRPVHDYYVRNISNVEIDRLQPVVDLLNDAVDPAIGNVFKLEQNAGGMTFQDIILAVREILLSDGKDLVLLVEDFAALAGIQEVLLKVCIQEGQRDGKRVRATMRTALALTDGYLSFRDTILTRAQREWVIGGHPQSDNEIKAAVVEMVAAYLNAARWGETELQRRFRQRDPEQSLTEWLPEWRDEDLSDIESEAIAAFGFNSNGNALFPFNRSAIEALTMRHLMVGGKLEFRPRWVINYILRTTLLMRPEFERNAFPPHGYAGLAPNANLANWIRTTHQPEAISRRLATLLTVWGGDPLDPSAIAHIPPSIFTTFGLPTPAELANVQFIPKPVQQNPTFDPINEDQPAIGKDTRKSSAIKEPFSEDPKVADLRIKLDAWSKGAQLGQNDARDIRNALFEMLKDAVDLPELRLRNSDLRAAWLNIPNARGNPQSEPKLNICDDYTDEFGITRAALIAAFRFVSMNNKKWTYPQADDDYVASAQLIDHLVSQLKPKLIKDAKAQTSTLVRTLITQSRIAGLPSPIKITNFDAMLSGLFSKPEAKPVSHFDENWDKLYAIAIGPIGTGTVASRDVLQSELLARSGCFQGESGRTPFAIDIMRLFDWIATDTPDPVTSDGLSDDLKAYVRQLSENRIRPQLRSVIEKLRTFGSEIVAYTGTDFDKAAFTSDLQAIVMLMAKTGTTPTTGPNLKEFEKSLIDFRQTAFVDLVTKAEIIVKAADESDDPSKLLNALGSIDLAIIARVMSFLQQATVLVTASEATVAREELNRSQSDPTALIDELTNMLTVISGQAPSHVGAQS